MLEHLFFPSFPRLETVQLFAPPATPPTQRGVWDRRRPVGPGAKRQML